MRYALLVLAMLGILVAGLALEEHYRIGTSPCSINEKWDCGIVNKSEYAVFFGVPVAAIGMAGYAMMGVLAFKRAYRALLAAALAGLGFSLYLTYVEARILEVWCIYCVSSLGIITLISLLVTATVIMQRSRKPVVQGA